MSHLAFLEEAAALAGERGYSGVGVMLSDGLTGIDLDGCVEDGAIAPWARDIVDRMGSYAEVSPSGTGVHILCYADPAKVGAVGRADHGRGIEVYNHGRYFTVTGDTVGPGVIADRTSELASFVAEAFPGESAEDSAARAVGSLVRGQVARRANETVIANVRRDRKSGARFARVPMGSETCDFCTMLASRGFVYHSEKTAGEFDHFHSSCRCKVVPGFPEMEFYVENGVKVSRGRDPKVEGYDPDAYFDMWRHSEKYRELDVVHAKRESMSRVRPTPWENSTVSALKTPDEVEEYVGKRFEASVTQEFKEIDIEIQKGLVAGLDFVKNELGDFEVNTIGVTKKKGLFGGYNPLTSSILVRRDCGDPYATGVHEAAHALDAFASSSYKEFLTTSEEKAYSLFSDDVVKSALKDMGIRKNSRKLKDYISGISGTDLHVFKEIYNDSSEMFAYSVELFAKGKGGPIDAKIFETARRKHAGT